MTPGDRSSNIIAFPATGGRDADSEDSSLMIRFVREGDDAAFDVLAERYYATALALARSKLGEECLAQDVVQETFLRVFRERRRYDPKRSFAPWFYTILRNMATDASRGRTRRREGMERFAHGERCLPRAATRADDCGDLLSALPAADREILIYQYIHGMTLGEIAALLRIGAEAAKKRSQRALKKLKEAVSRDGVSGRIAICDGT